MRKISMIVRVVRLVAIIILGTVAVAQADLLTSGQTSSSFG